MTGRLRRRPYFSVPLVALAVLALLAAACGSSKQGSGLSTASTASEPGAAASALAPIHGTYAPTIDPANFVATIDNRYFPLVPGTGFHYKGVAENGKTPQTDDMVVTHQTKTILGVNVHRRPRHRLLARQADRADADWYAQDKDGNVWYMGEDTRELQHGKFVKASDSWEAGVDGAEPGIIMPGDPQPGDTYRQEYYPRYALDQARVLGTGRLRHGAERLLPGHPADSRNGPEARPGRRRAQMVRRRSRGHQGAHRERQSRGDRARDRDEALARRRDEPVPHSPYVERERRRSPRNTAHRLQRQRTPHGRPMRSVRRSSRRAHPGHLARNARA